MLDSITLARKGAHTAGSREPITPRRRSFPRVSSLENSPGSPPSLRRRTFPAGARVRLPQSSRATTPTSSLRINTISKKRLAHTRP